MCVCVGGGGGGTLLFSCIQRLGSFFEVKNFEFHIFESFQKKKIGGYKDLVDILGGHHKIGLYLGVSSQLVPKSTRT